MEDPYWFWATGSKVKVKFGNICSRSCVVGRVGTTSLWAWYRVQFLPYHFQTPHVSCLWWEETYWFWVVGSKVKANFCILFIKPCGHDTDYSFAQLFSNFICKLWIMRGGTLLILVVGSKVKVNFGALAVKPCGHDKDYSVLLITFKLQKQLVGNERRNPVALGLQGKRSSLALCLGNIVVPTRASFFVQLLSNFTCKLLRGGTLLVFILSHRVQGQSQFWDSACGNLLEHRLQFLPYHFQASDVSCG